MRVVFEDGCVVVICCGYEGGRVFTLEVRLTGLGDMLT